MTSKYVRYTEETETIQQAWTFIMDYMDEFHGRPNIEIRATTFMHAGDEEWTQGFVAMVYGIVEGEEDEDVGTEE